MVDMLGPSFVYEDVRLPSFPNIQSNMKKLQSFVPNKNDVFLCSYPKSGTHWAYEIMYMLLKGEASYTPADKPMNNIESQEEFCDSREHIESASCILHSHLPCDLLPSQILHGSNKIVYIMRNPKDQLISLYFHIQGFKWTSPQTFEEFFDTIIENPSKMDYGHWFRNAMQWWDKFHNKENIMFIFYEDMIQNLFPIVKQLSEFLECNASEQLLLNITRKTQFQEMKEKKPIGDWQHGWHKDNFSVYRRGQVGNWKKYFTREMNAKFEQFYNNMLHQYSAALPIKFE